MKLRIRKKLADIVDCSHYRFNGEDENICRLKNCYCDLRYEDCKAYTTNKRELGIMRSEAKENKKMARNKSMRDKKWEEFMLSMKHTFDLLY